MYNIQEGINDKNLFKAVFLAGSAGSGKSFIAENMFLSKKIASPYGLKVVNSDYLFELGLEKAGLSKVINADRKSLYLAQMAIRDHAKKLTKKRQAMWINGMLPIVIDGTGKDFEKISRQSDSLQSIGYDTLMIFVNTSLDVALERNNQRKRKVDPSIVTKMWKEVQNNIGKFQQYFGGENFIIIDNNKYLEGSDLVQFLDNLFRIGKKIIEAPLRNPIGLSIIDELRQIGGKYLSDLAEG